MSIKNLYPSQRPEIIYNVINGRNELPVNSTFSRDSEATVINSAGFLEVVQANQPRFNYDLETGEFLGLMLEPATKNSASAWNDPASAGLAYQGIRIEQYETVLPDGTVGNCLRVYLDQDENSLTYGTLRFPGNNSDLDSGALWTASWWVKRVPGDPNYPGAMRCFINVGNQGTEGRDVKEDWTRISITDELRTGNTGGLFGDVYLSDSTRKQQLLVWGVQLEKQPEMTSYILSTTSNEREADKFSLLSSRNIDAGFSLLLDSQTTTENFIYKLKASGTEIASLSNSGGTLDWTINGKSAKTNGEYPQVGFLPGRVRTISSYGPAEQGDVENYLYTTGISFPTIAEPASGADEVEFGTPLTLKALYGWQGQLDATNAISLIKGEYNVVPNEDTLDDAYCFIYNTDISNIGNKDMTLPGIDPTVSMTVYWGDGTQNAYEKGFVPSHTYPYPGLYKIQCVADDGFDRVRLGNYTDNVIENIVQWAPQHRVDASGPGFTGNDMVNLLYVQTRVKNIPPFKYTDLTSLRNAFTNLTEAEPDGWNWVPYVLPECTDLTSAFQYVAAGTTGEIKQQFPQLQTSDKLIDARACFYLSGITGWVEKDNGDAPTNKPFTDSSNVENFNTCFMSCGLNSLDLDTSSATSIKDAFRNNSFVTFPFFDFGKVINADGAWRDNRSMTTFPFVDLSKVTSLSGAWANCTNLANFPPLSLERCSNFKDAWFACASFTSFPSTIIVSTGRNFDYCWYQNSELLGFPTLDFSEAQSMSNTWAGCEKMTVFGSESLNFDKLEKAGGTWSNCKAMQSFPVIANGFPLCTNFNSTWSNTGLTSFPVTSMPKGENFSYAWVNNVNLTAFPAGQTLPRWSICQSAWQGNRNLTDFPAGVFDTCTDTGISDQAFTNAFQNMALTAQSIENILVSIDKAAINIGCEITITGGTSAGKSTWTAAANAAFDSLIAKGCTIQYNE